MAVPLKERIYENNPLFCLTPHGGKAVNSETVDACGGGEFGFENGFVLGNDWAEICILRDAVKRYNADRQRHLAIRAPASHLAGE